jgi:CarboxypepD_reg-like domain
VRVLIILIIYLAPILSSGQTRIITGKVIADLDLEALIQVRIVSRDTIQLGTTDTNGKFRIELPLGTDQLLLNFVGMEWTSIKVPPNCDNLEIIMMYSGSYDFATVRTVNRKRSKRFKNLLNQHRQAYEKRIFSNDKPCFQYIFNKY